MQVSVRTADRVIVQIGSSLGTLPGCVIEDVDDAILTKVQTAFTQPNGGITLSADHTTITALPVPPPTQAEQNQAATRTAVQNQLAGIPGTAWTTLTATQKQAVIATWRCCSRSARSTRR